MSLLETALETIGFTPFEVSFNETFKGTGEKWFYVTSEQQITFTRQATRT